MFTHLIESGSHKKEFARKGRFFLGTLGFYGLLLMVAGVASVYAYNEQLGNQDLEVTLVTPVRVTEIERNPDVVRPARPSHTSGSANTGGLFRREIIASTDNPLIPKGISTHPAPPPSPPGAKQGTRDIGDGIVIGPPDNGSDDTGTTTSRVVVPVATDPDPLPPPRATPTPAKQVGQVRLPSVVISSKIITKPAPVYPAIARQTRVQGTVTVEILINEQGRVISAQATNGHPLLRAAAQSSAFQAKFSPTSISGQPVKVSGVITYNFILQ
ncbi:MAG TPA: energy transducer TonB [Pyrinomonadaceae bacterium]|jgi:protein TonB